MTLVINTVSDSTKAQKDLADLKKSVSSIESSVQKVTDGFGKMAAGIAAAGAALATTKAFLEMSDTMTNLDNKIKSVSASTEQYKRALQGVKDLALSTRTDMNATAQLYQRIAINQKEIGINTKDTLRVVEIVNKSMKIAGASTADATSALLQFGQALGSGKLQGDELRSLAENAPTLFKAIADGVGIPIGQMKKFGEEGKLVTSVIIPAIMKAGEDVDRVFGQLTVTYGDAFKNLGTAFTQLKDSASKYFFGSKNALAGWLNNIALSAGRVAKYFGYYMTIARANVALFVFNAILLFKRLMPAVTEIAKNIGSIAVGLFEKWAPELKKAGDYLRTWLGIVGGSLSGIFDAMGANLRGNTFFAPIIDAFYSVREFLRNSFKSIWNTLGVNTIDVGSFFKNFEPVKKMVLSFVHTLERAFFWLYDQVIGHSWIPDLVEGVEKWTSRLLKKPLAFVESFTEKVSDLFESITSPISGSGISSFIDSLKGGIGHIGKLIGKMGNMFSGNNSSFFDRVANKIRDLVKPKSALDKLKDRFKDAVTPKSSFEKMKDRVSESLKPKSGLEDMASSFKELFTTKAPFQKLKDGMGSAIDGVLTSMGIAIEGIVKLIPEKLQVPLALAASTAFAMAMGGLSSNPAVKTGLIALGTAIAAATSIRFLSPDAVSEAAFGFANTVLTVLSKGLEKLIGGNAFFNPVDLLTLLAKFALLFAAGRKFLGEAAGKLIQAPTKLGQNIGSRVDLAFAQREEKKLVKDLSELPNKVSRAVAETNKTFVDRQKELRNLLNQQTLARQSGGRGPDTSAALRAVTDARRDMEQARRDQAGVANLSRDVKNSINDQRVRGDQIKLALKESGEKFRESFRTNTGALGGLVGGVGGMQLGTDFLKVIPNAPEWVKVATVISAGFIGQVIGSSIGSVFASAVTYAFKNAGSLVANVLSVLPWWAQAVIGIAGALYVGYQLFQSLPDSWNAAINRFFGVGGPKGDEDIGTAGLISMIAQIGAALALGLTVFKKFPAIADWFKGIFTGGAGGIFKSRFEVWISSFVNALSKFTPTIVKDFGVMLMGLFRGFAAPIAAAVRSVPGPVWFKLVAGLLLVAVGSRAIAEEKEPKTPEARERKTIDSVRNQLAYSGNTAMMMDPSIIEEILPYPSAQKGKQSFMAQSDVSSEMDRLKKRQTNRDLRDNSQAAIDSHWKKTPTFLDKSDVWLGELSGLLKDNSTGKEIIENLRGYVKDLGRKQPAGFSPEEGYKGLAAGTTGAKGSETVKAFSDAFKGMDNKAIGATMADYLNKNGFKNISGEELGDAATKNPAYVGMLANLVDKLAEMDNVTKKLGPNTLEGAASNFEAGKIRKQIDEFMIQNLDFKEKDTKLVNPTDGEDPAAAKKGKFDHFEDLFNNIAKMFPELNLTLEQFLSMQESSAIALSDLAQAAIRDQELLNKTVIGKKLEGKMGEGDLAARKAVFDSRKTRLTEAEGIVKPTRSSTANLIPLFNEVQVGLSEDILNALRDGTLKGLEDSATKIKSIKDSLAKTPDLPDNEAIRIKLAEQLKTAVTDMQDKARAAILEASASFEKVSLLGASSGVDISRELYNRLSQVERDALLRTLVLLETKQKEANADGVAPAVSKSIQEDIDAIKLKLKTDIAKTGLDAGEESGKAFASSLKDSFASAFGGALRGQQDENRSVLLTLYDRMLDSLTNGILDTFTKSFADSLMGEGSPIFGGIKDLGKGVANFATGLFGGSKEPTITDASKGLASSDAAFNAATGQEGLKTTLEGGWAKLKSTLDTSWTDFSGVLDQGWSGLGNILNDSLSGLIGMFGGSAAGAGGTGGSGWAGMLTTVMSFFADGGKVSGPGSSRSDSIPAMLSNGEFVVNARQAGRYMPLLNAINSGQMSHFADGGLVAPVNIASIEAPRSMGGSSTSTFNITITGDISNQTRSEIQRMIPQIASGVNTHNYEKGNRR